MILPDLNIQNVIGRIGNHNAKITVSTEALVQKASSLDIKIRKMREMFEELEQAANNTSSYWNGEAGEAFRERYSEYKDTTDTIIRRLSEHIVDLNKMAGIYQEAENDIKDIIEDLPNDVIL